MRRICLALLVLGLVAGAGPLWAQDTSPYLVGFIDWHVEDSGGPAWNHFNVVNPTAKYLDVYVVLYRPEGPCLLTTWHLPPNAADWFGLSVGLDNTEHYYPVKFFAFPMHSRKFDPNAVIGGFQRKGPTRYQSDFISEANLKAVAINSYTLGEFRAIPWDNACATPP